MSFFLKFVPFLMAIGVLLSCDQAQKSDQEQATDGEKVAEDWNMAKEAYHEVMAGTFHPAEEGDLAPVKEKYESLADLSAAWAKLPLPENEKGKDLEKWLKKLSEDSGAIGETVQQGDDEAIKNAIFALHDVFHEIVGLCDHDH